MTDRPTKCADPIELREPTIADEQQVMAYKAEFLEAGDHSFDGCAGLDVAERYADWLDHDNWLRKLYGDGCVPSTVYLAVRKRDGKVVGMIDYRHRLSDFLLRYGGNVGYSVLPSQRRRGYASEMLRLLKDKCREMGTDKLLLTCDKQNTASAKTIWRNGGVLENEVADHPGLGESGVVQRYWITL